MRRGRRRPTLSGQVPRVIPSRASASQLASRVAALARNMAGPKVAWHCACFIVLVLFTVAEALLSGLYIDNGDQTMIHHSMTRNERLVVEHEILDLLGLGDRPRRARAPPLDRSAPSFLLDVYKQLSEEHEQARPTRSSEMALSGDEQQAIDQSDLIMTFQSKSELSIPTRKSQVNCKAKV